MEEAATPASPAASAPAERRSAWLGIGGLAALALLAVPLIAPGPGLIPAAGPDPPGWLLGVYGEGFGVGPLAYYGLLWGAFLAHLCVFLGAPALDRRLLVAASAVLIGAFALAPPLLSQDVFSYLSYARLGALEGLDPYLHAPAAAPQDPVLPYVGWPDSASVYGPLFTLATYPLALLSVPAALWSLKAVVALSVLGLALLVARVAPARGVDPRRGFAMVALNPLVLVHVVGGAHNDAPTMLLAFAGAAAVLAAREATGGFAVVAAIGLKASAGLLAPFALLGAARRRRFAAGALAAAAATALVAHAAFGWNWLEAFGLAGENQGRVSNYSAPNLLSELLGADVDLLRSLAAVAFLAVVAALLVGVYRGADWIRATGWAALALLLATAWILPWYIVWALPFAAISRDERLVVAVFALTALQLAARVPL